MTDLSPTRIVPVIRLHLATVRRARAAGEACGDNLDLADAHWQEAEEATDALVDALALAEDAGHLAAFAGLATPTIGA